MAAETGLEGETREVGSPADALVRSLQEWRAVAGNPSYAELANRVARRRQQDGSDAHEARVARTTVYDLFRLGRRRLDTDLLLEVVAALGVTASDLTRWEHAITAFHRGEEQASVPVSPAPEPEPEPEPTAERAPVGLLDAAAAVRPFAAPVAAGLMVLCVAVNVLGNTVTDLLPLMLYLDMVGTAIAAVVLGPWHGALVGLATNLACIPQNDIESLYFAAVNIAGALVWGYGVRSGRFRSLARFLLLCCLTGFVCTLVAGVLILVVFTGGHSEHGSDRLVDVMLAHGNSLVVSVFSMNLVTSLADKMISGLLALVALEAVVSRGRASADSDPGAPPARRA